MYFLINLLSFLVCLYYLFFSVCLILCLIILSCFFFAFHFIISNSLWPMLHLLLKALSVRCSDSAYRQAVSCEGCSGHGVWAVLYWWTQRTSWYNHFQLPVRADCTVTFSYISTCLEYITVTLGPDWQCATSERTPNCEYFFFAMKTWRSPTLRCWCPLLDNAFRS